MPESGPIHRNPLIWIVDDSPTEAAITERSLGAGYRTRRFSDGTTAVEELVSAKRLPDLLLLDWVMPGMTGDEVTRFLRSRSQTQELPIILVTASRIDTQDVVAGLAVGANDYVPRPFAPEELRARVQAALRTKQLSDLATRERQRLTTVNRLGHALFQAMPSPVQIIDELARALTSSLCEGCSVLIFPGPLPEIAVAHHRTEPRADHLAVIASVADPCVHQFASAAEALATLPPAYASYIALHGLRGLAILPFPAVDPVRGIVTVTREGDSEPFDSEDIATIETCIEHASLAIERVMRFDSERVARMQLDTVLGSLPIGIIATAENGAVTLVNAAALALVPGVAAARTLVEVFELPSWTDPDGVPIGALGDLFGGGPIQLPVGVDLMLRGEDGAPPSTIAVSAVPLRNGLGAVVGRVTVLEDVSAERAITEQRERTAQFQQELLAIVGHDLRSPLGAVVTATEILQLDLPPETRHGGIVRRIRSSATRMTGIIEQLLDVTQARLGGGIPVALTEGALLPLVTGVAEELTLAYPKTRFEVHGTDVVGHWDPDRLGQVVSNLASNAAQYGRPGEPVTIEIGVRGEQAMICVRNAIRGEPISDAALQTMFQPYKRGGASGHSSGLGLGLYIVSGIVKAHRGKIEVESTAAGTVFRVLLPVVRRQSA